jgi:hypothetical protein
LKDLEKNPFSGRVFIYLEDLEIQNPALLEKIFHDEFIEKSL